jgi:hypothetical protein
VYYHDGTSCYRSPFAYPPLIAAVDRYSLTFAAGSGATTVDVISSELGSLSPSTSLVTIQIGGNDVGFLAIITDCAAFYFPCQNAINTANSFIQNTLPGLLDKTYSDIRAAAPRAEIVVLGYPLHPRSAFSTHDLCTASPWLNNVTLPVIRSFHPKIAGEVALARLIEAALP